MEYTINSTCFPQNAIRIFPDQIVETTAKGTVELDRAMGGEAKYGKLHLREDIKPLFEGWLAPHPIIEYVPAEKSVGIMIPTVGRPHSGNITGTTIYDSKIKLNMMDVGKYLSLEYNFRYHIMNSMRSDEGQKLAAFLNKLGYKAEDIDYIAIGFVPDKAIYAIGRLPNGKVVIYANKDSYKKIANEAENFGMEEEELREVAIFEELAHSFRKSYDKAGIPEEAATKTVLKGFYETLAKTTSNPELKAKYARIIKHLEHDISTVSRYAKMHSNNLQDLVDLYYADVGELERVLELEALEQGINTGKGISKYKSAKLEEIADAADKEYSEKDGAAEDVDAEMSEYAERAESSDGKNAEGEACAEAEGEAGGGGGGGGEGGE